MSIQSSGGGGGSNRMKPKLVNMLSLIEAVAVNEASSKAWALTWEHPGISSLLHTQGEP